MKTAAVQLGVLAEKKRKDEEGNAADNADFEKVREMSQRGTATNSRISETRRAALMSSTPLLQTVVEISNIERQRHEYAMQLERLEYQRRIELLRELQDTNVKVAQLTARIRSVGEKLLYSSTLQSQLVGGATGRPEFSVVRVGEKQATPATEDTELFPGDTVTVVLHAGAFAGTIPQN
jgi:polysaccharide export outer membrane protein